MWAINGAASVVGSALTIVVAMAAGYRFSLALGVGCYALAAFSAYRLTGPARGPAEEAAPQG